ncbi:MAG: ATP-binding protein [Bacteroidetes bacterium]|nr:MAG: ATP-binding protein [Bacteroidota bacterium]
MERIIKHFQKKLKSNIPEFKRYLYNEIDWNQRLILILGHRGAGKTTLLLQKVIEQAQNSIYFSLDDFYFEENRLIILLESLYEKGYRNFYLDEVHRYEYWSKDIKMAYDQLDDAHFYITGSSILEIDKAQADLSRRASVFHLSGLSFREFLKLEYKQDFETYTLNDVISKHQEISTQITDSINIIPAFNKYLEFGYFPFYKEDKQTYKSRLQEIVRVVIEMDIAPNEDISYSSLRKMEKLLFIISQIVPFTPNISELAIKLDTSRNSVLKMLDLLAKADILLLLKKDAKGMSFLQKPEKVYLNNTNLAFSFTDQPNPGNLRETFFLNQLSVKHAVSSPKFGDFMVDDQYIFEIGGPNKTSKQIKGIPNSYIAADKIKFGTDKTIPLWLFGFLY